MLKLVLLLAVASFAHGSHLRSQRLTGASGLVLQQATFDSEANLHDAKEDKDIVRINGEFNYQGLVDGDIKRVSKDRNSIVDTTLFWPTTTIPVAYGPNLGLLAISGIMDARQEYEMRTCFKFPDRTDEEDFLVYQLRSGCWSSVGKQGGAQPISIGNGCENMATIIHEMMHAIGIYHEQSRTDRDGYITIETQNIDADKVYNFDKYGYNIVDDRRVPYDFNSVMHYGETAFSNNGEKTILTIDPAFQEVIGQRRTFSDGDITLINRMYSCADPVRVSYSCSFDDETACGYVQDTTDDVDWLRYIVGETDAKAISTLLPQVDNTQGTSGTGSYMVLDTSDKQPGQTGVMASMRLKSNNPEQCLEFAYYMDLEAGSEAGIGVYMGEIDQSTGVILSNDPILTITGDHENYWNIERLNIQAPSKYKLIFAAKSGATQNDAIAIDDISVLDKPCDTAYFVINDFSALLANTPQGDGIYGPLLYTEEGYAFKILFFPHGSSSAASDYVSMYFALAQGNNDDSLAWPFYNQVIKMSIVDQGSDALSRMSQSLSYITGSSGGAVWDKPTSEVNSAWGFPNFMPLSDIQNTRNFLKNDAIVISINVRDMNAYSRDHASAFFHAEPKQRDSHDHEIEEEEHTDIHVNIIAPDAHQHQEEPNHPDEKTISPALVGGVAFACSLGVFIIMSIMIVCINQSHKQAVAAIAIVKNQAAKERDASFSNFSYEEELKKNSKI